MSLEPPRPPTTADVIHGLFTGALLSTAVLLAIPFALFAFSDGPAPGHTGGFGEPSCHACHFDNSPEDRSGALKLSGLPELFAPGTPYHLEVAVEKSDLERGGFQLAARFASGEHKGRQAGHFERLDDRTQVLKMNTDGHEIEYVQHTEAGSHSIAGNTLSWPLRWIAPAASTAPVAFHLVANAANDDDSEFGDFIYTREWVSRGIR